MEIWLIFVQLGIHRGLIDVTFILLNNIILFV